MSKVNPSPSFKIKPTRAIEIPADLSDQQREKYREVMELLHGDSTGFLHAAVAVAARRPDFMDRVSHSLHERGVEDSASTLAACPRAIELSPESLASILELPSIELYALASAAEQLQKRHIPITPDLMHEIYDRASVIRVMEDSRVLSEKSDDFFELPGDLPCL